ncbi:acylneuraminate cytidylyltransferase family protein [Vibrio harveyi]|nr:acylneuraminate cytidylyltransferase family protein [Vibrio harveyi]
MNVIAIIPARGGSKGVPKKNIKELNNKPLIAYTIEQASNTKNIDHVVVSTDCNEIADISREYGAEVIMRPQEISGDLASSEDALIHCVKEFHKRGESVSHVVFLQCTSPIRKPSDISECLELVLSNSYDSALSVVENHKFLWRVNANGIAEPVNYDPQHRKMRQEISEFQENGSIYVMKTSDLLKTKCRLNGNVGVHIMDEETGYEIDTPVDFEIIKKLMSK